MEKQLSGLVVDDEEKAVALLRKLLSDTGQFAAIESAGSVSEASRILKNFSPDLIFLDVEMPDKNGIALLDELRSQGSKSRIVFVTAYQQYAIDAIRAHALGYLLKPVSRDELDNCISDYREWKHASDYHTQLHNFFETFQQGGKRIRINARTGYHLIDTDEILYCEADGNYSMVYTSSESHICSLQLHTILEMLPPHFHRIGRSLIVNSRHVRYVDRKAGLLTLEKGRTERSVKVTKSELRALDELHRP